jgi:hypothetical protein
LTVVSHTNTSNGRLEQLNNGEFRYTPNDNFDGTDSFQYTITDGHKGHTDTATVTIVVDEDGGGGGGRGGRGRTRGDRDVNLDIFNERVVRHNTSCALVTWNTNIKATSRVVYGDNSVRNLDDDERDYGYDETTREFDFDTKFHTVLVCGLDFSEINYFRPVSDHPETPEETGIELNLRPGVTGQCSLRIEDYMRIDFRNDPIEVLKLQGFLRVFEKETSVPLSGKFDRATDAAVRRFQVKYNDDILNPWGYEDDESTGYVYILTKKKINEILCGADDVLTAAHLIEIRNFKAYQDSLAARGIDYAGPLVDGPYPWQPEFHSLKSGQYTTGSAGVGGAYPQPTPVPPKVGQYGDRETPPAVVEDEPVTPEPTTPEVVEEEEDEPSDLDDFLGGVLDEEDEETSVEEEEEETEEEAGTSTEGFSDRLAGALFSGIDGVMGLLLSVPFLIVVLFILVGLLIVELRSEYKQRKETDTDETK